MSGVKAGLFCWLCMIELCGSSAVIEIRLVRFNTSGLLSTSLCCDTGAPPPCPADQCDPRFDFCLQDFSGQGCHEGNVSTGYVANKDTILFSDVIGDSGTSNPFLIHVDDYPGVVIAKVTVYDEDSHEGGSSKEKMDYLQYVYRFQPDTNGSQHPVSKVPLRGATSILDIEISVHCDQNYYGNKCDVRCLPDSHHYCDGNGKLTCNQGEDCSGITKTPTTVKSSSTVAVTSMSSSKSTPSSSAPSTVTPSSIQSTQTYDTSTQTPTTSTRTSNTPTTAKSSTGTTATTGSVNFTSAPGEMAVSLQTENTLSIASSYAGPKGGVTVVTAITTESFQTTTATSYRCFYNLSSSDNGVSFYTDNTEAEWTSELAQFVNNNDVDEPSLSNATFHVNIKDNQTEDHIRWIRITRVKRVDGLSVNMSVFGQIIQDFCSRATARPYQDVKGDDPDTLTIVVPTVVGGLIALATIPLVYFLYRRKCRKRQTNPLNTTDVQNVPTPESPNAS